MYFLQEWLYILQSNLDYPDSVRPLRLVGVIKSLDEKEDEYF